MTTKEKQQELIKYIQGEIPSILDLKFGCKVRRKDGRYTKNYLDNIGIFIGKSYTNNNVVIKFEKNNAVSICEKSELKIIGRPITLSDILRVIGKSEIESKTDIRYHLIDNEWNLEKDFNNQSEEFYNWLYDLLINQPQV